MSSHKTIRLHNLSPTANLSLHLHQLKASAHGSMKRGPMLTPILIGAGVAWDVCAHLGVGYEEAKSIVDRSPEVQAFKNSNRLAILDHPPAHVAPAPVAAPAAVEPPAPPKPPVVEVVPPPPPPPPADEPVPPVPEPEMRVLTDDPTPIPGTVRRGDPSMDWAEDELRFYADARGIDVSKAKSKTQILRMIKGTK